MVAKSIGSLGYWSASPRLVAISKCVVVQVPQTGEGGLDWKGLA